MNQKIVIIRFSDRLNGNCNAIASYIQEYLKSKTIKLYKISAKTMHPCGNCDYECLKSGSVCPNLTFEQKAMYDSICNADVAYYIIPNYCGFPCANYYAFNERSVGYFNLDKVLLEKFMSVKKRFIIVSNTEVQNFEHAMMQQTKEPEIMYLKTSKYGKKSIAGDLMESEAAKADLLAFLNA